MKRPFIATRNRKNVAPSLEDLTPKNTQQEESLTLEQALTIFLRAKEAEGVRSSTRREYVRHINYLSDYLTEVKAVLKPSVSNLSAETIRDYITYLLTEKTRYERSQGRKDKYVGLSVNTVNIRLRTLRTMCRFWHGEGFIDHDPMSTIKPVKADEESEVEGLTEGEVERILEQYDVTQFAEWRDKTLVLLLLDTGLRIQEAISLTMERVDFTTLTISVPSKVAKNRRNREVAISKEVAKLLYELNEESQNYFGETEQIFNTAYGEPYTSDSFRKRLNRLKKKLGMPSLSPHRFRHTFARDYLLNGGDPFSLQKILDHSDIKTTRKYVQMNTEHVRQQHTRYSPLRKYLRRKP